MLRAPVEGVNFQAVKDLKSLASTAALKGPASASKWLSAQTRLPRRRRPLHSLFHHLLDVKSSPEPISVIIFTLTHTSHPWGVLDYLPPRQGTPLGIMQNAPGWRRKSLKSLSPVTWVFPTSPLLTPSPAQVSVCWDQKTLVNPFRRSGGVPTPSLLPISVFKETLSQVLTKAHPFWILLVRAW